LYGACKNVKLVLHANQCQELVDDRVCCMICPEDLKTKQKVAKIEQIG
jgi:hypothetical protein